MQFDTIKFSCLAMSWLSMHWYNVDEKNSAVMRSIRMKHGACPMPHGDTHRAKQTVANKGARQVIDNIFTA